MHTILVYSLKQRPKCRIRTIRRCRRRRWSRVGWRTVVRRWTTELPRLWRRRVETVVIWRSLIVAVAALSTAVRRHMLRRPMTLLVVVWEWGLGLAVLLLLVMGRRGLLWRC